MKFRDLVHTQDEATVPENLKAVEPRAWRSYDDVKRKLIGHMSAKGKDFYTPAELSTAAGMTGVSSIYPHLKKMEKEGKLRKIAIGKYVFVKKSDLPTGGPKNGPVYTTTIPTEKDNEQILEEALEEATKEEAAEVPEIPTWINVERVQAPRYDPQYPRYDQLIWEYVKIHPEQAVNFIEFSSWLKEKMSE